MGKINVTLPDGRVVSVDEDTAKTSGLAQEGAGQAMQRESDTARHEAFGGVGGAVGEALVSAGDTMSFGALGAGANLLGGDTMQRARQASYEENPNAHVVGEVGAMLLPTGLLGDGAKAASELTGFGAAAKIGEGVSQYAGKTVGRAVEGSIFGMGAHIADTNISGDPLTIEGMVESAGTGALLNMGAGLVLDKMAGGVEGFADRADQRLLEGNKLKGDLEAAQKGAKVFGDAPPSWEEFRESHEAAQDSIAKQNRATTRDQVDYDEFITKNAGIGSATEKAQSAINGIRNEELAAANKAASEAQKALYESPAWNEVRDLHNSTENELGRANKVTQSANDKYAGVVGSNEKLTGAIDEAEQLVKSRRGLYSDNAKNPAQWIDGKPRSVQTATEFNKEGVGTEKQVLINQKPPITAELRQKYDNFDARISDMYKKKAGGWKLNGDGKWIRDPSVPADPHGTLEDLRALHKDLATEMPKGSGKKLSDLPSAPQELRTSSGIKVPKRMTDLATLSDVQLGKLAAGMSESAQGAIGKLAEEVGVPAGGSVEDTLRAIREKVRTVDKPMAMDPQLKQSLDGYAQRVNEVKALRVTDPKAALENLRGLQNDMQTEFAGRAKGLKDLPNIPGDLKPELPKAAQDLPKSLYEFSKKTPQTIAAMANGIDPASSQAFDRLAGDLGLTPQESPADTLTAVHRKLGEYRGAIERSKAALEKKAFEDAQKPMILKLLNKAARYAAGRTFDFGGIGGAIARVAGGEATGRVMTGVEDAVLGGEMMRSKLGVRGKLATIVSKYGRPSAAVLRKLPPVTAYLGTSFLTGEKDKAKSPQEQAVNRINEILAANHTAPDNAYTAVQGLMGHPGDVAFKLHQHIVGTLQYLVSTLPRDPGIDMTMFGSNWQPSHADSVALAHRLEAAQDPLSAIARAIGGEGHPAATQTLWARYPAIMSELSQEIAMAAPDLHSLTYEQAGVYRDIFQMPMTGLQHPIVVTTIQGLYLPKPPPGAPSSGGGKQPTGNPNGRPAAVQSPVAGSSVSALINQ